MPLYEYLCRGCDKPSELLIRGREKPACPECGGQDLLKLLSVPAAPACSSDAPRDAGPPAGPCGGACACFPGG